MFNRVLIKKESLNHLRSHWRFPLYVFITTQFLYLCFNAKSLISTLFNFELSSPSIAGFLWFCISPILTMATQFFYLKFVKSKDDAGFNTFLEGLNLWLKGLLSFLYVFIKTLLWSLLLIVPGIIKGISYSMTSCIIAENPSISITKAVRLSMLLTKGYLLDILTFYLSFTGWFIIYLLTGSLFGLWLVPYFNTSFTFLYLYLKETALESGSVTRTDFNS